VDHQKPVFEGRIVKKMIARKDIPAAVRRITGGARNPHEATVWRWYTRGVAGILLNVHRFGGEVFTTEQDLRDFFALTTAQPKERRQMASLSFATIDNSRANAFLDSRGL
jgi:hypothetical protein